MAADDLSRLPRWAQNRITALERDLAAARARLAAGPEDSDTFADPYSTDAVRPLGQGPLVRFGGPGFDCTFDVTWQDDGIAIQGNSGWPREMVIRPQASNTVRLYFAESPRKGAQ